MRLLIISIMIVAVGVLPGASAAQEQSFVQKTYPIKEYYPDGQLKFEKLVEKCLEGMTDLSYRSYYESGKIEYESICIGEEDGWFGTSYDENGEVIGTEGMIGGVLHGDQKSFDVNGKLSSIVRYDHGKLLDEKGRLKTGIVEGISKIDKRMYRDFYRDGEKQWSKIYYDNGQIEQFVNYSDQSRKEYYPNGKLKTMIISGERGYVEKRYDDKGNLLTTISF